MKTKSTQTNQQEVKLTPKGIISLILILATIILALVLFVRYETKIVDEEDAFINSSFNYTKGKIIDKTTYKGWTLKVEYKVGNSTYSASRGVINNNYKVGDSIKIKYSKTRPDMIIIDLKNQ